MCFHGQMPRRCCVVVTDEQPWKETCRILDNFASQTNALLQKYRASGVPPVFVAATKDD